MTLEESLKLQEFLDKHGPFFSITIGRALESDEFEIRMISRRKELDNVLYWLLKLPETKELKVS